MEISQTSENMKLSFKSTEQPGLASETQADQIDQPTDCHTQHPFFFEPRIFRLVR